MAAYKYKQLDASNHEIRLIRLTNLDKNTKEDQPISCEIATFSIDDKPEYVALSYAWGHPGRTAALSTNGGELGITRNLQEALQQFREEQHSFWFWIDAICINQNDDVEKSWQVQQMRRVYETANHVLIWLGPAADGSDLAFERLNTCGVAVAEHICIKNHQIAFWWGQFQKGSAPEVDLKPTDPTLEQILSCVKIDDEPDATIPLKPTIALLSRPWWRRIWVLQEMWVAKTAFFACGQKRLPAVHMAAAMTVFRLYFEACRGSLYATPNGEVEPDMDLRPYLMLNSRMGDVIGSPNANFKISLKGLLLTTSPYFRETRRLNASDDRDRVFALLQLCGDSEVLGIRADYTKTSVQLYTNTTLALIRKEGLNILCLCYFPKKLPGLPSWVIDWSAPSQGYYIGFGADGKGVEFGPNKTIFGCNPPYCASKGILTSQEFYFDKGGAGTLCLLASQLDVIEDGLREDVLETLRRDYQATSRHKGSLKNPYNNIINTSYRQNGSASSTTATLICINPESIAAGADGFTNFEELSAKLDAAAYTRSKMFDTETVHSFARIAQNFTSAIRQMARAGEKRYGGPVGIEDAIWRTCIADQDVSGRDEWVRPATCFLSLLLLLPGGPRTMPTGLFDLVGFALTQRLHRRLLHSGLFSEFVVEAARDIVYNRLPLRPLKLSTGKRLGAALRKYGVLESVGIKTEDDLDKLWHDQILPDEAVLANVHALMEKIRKFDVQEEIPKMVVDAEKYLVLVQSMMLGRTMFVTKTGYLGLGPMHIQPTDIVVIAHNAIVPLILRPQKSGNYQFVGECYVHGMMDGEFMSLQTQCPKLDIYKLQ